MMIQKITHSVNYENLLNNQLNEPLNQTFSKTPQSCLANYKENFGDYFDKQPIILSLPP